MSAGSISEGDALSAPPFDVRTGPTGRRGKRAIIPGDAVGTAPDPPRGMPWNLSAPIFDVRTGPDQPQGEAGGVSK